jgi:hypothetical protein
MLLIVTPLRMGEDPMKKKDNQIHQNHETLNHKIYFMSPFLKKNIGRGIPPFFKLAPSINCLHLILNPLPSSLNPTF